MLPHRSLDKQCQIDDRYEHRSLWNRHCLACISLQLPQIDEGPKELAARFEQLDELWQHFVHVAHDAKVCNTEDRCFFVFVDGNDVL